MTVQDTVEVAHVEDEIKHEEKIVSTIDLSELCLFKPLPEIFFETGSIFDINWWDTANVAYAASLLFGTDLMELLTHKVALMKSGSFMISLRPLCLDLQPEYKQRIVLVSESFFKMSWQMAKVYIYRIV